MQQPIPFACDMSALTTAQRSEHHDVMRSLFGAVNAIREVEQGYSFTLASDDGTLGLSGRFIALERRCCPFFSFHLYLGPDADPVLVISGPPGVQPFIQAEFSSVLPAGMEFPPLAASTQDAL